MNSRLTEFFEVTIAELEKIRDKRVEDVDCWENRIRTQKEAIAALNREIGELLEAKQTLIDSYR